MPKNKNPLLNYIYFGLDNFEFNIPNLKKDFFLYNELVFEIDDDNSSFAFIDIGTVKFTYEKINIKGYGLGIKFTTSINGVAIPIFSILHGKIQENLLHKSKSKDKVVLYSSFFILDNLGYLPFSIKDFVGINFNIEKSNVYRLDICLDVPNTIKELSPVFIDLKKPSSAIGTDKKHPEFYQTYYLGEIQSSKNRNSIIRIYDKVLDTFKKHKSFLYPHLEKNTDVRRIELELRPEQAKRLNNYYILDIIEDKNNILGDIFSKYINTRIPEEYRLTGKELNIIPYKKHFFDLTKSFLSLGHIHIDYLKRVSGYIENVFKSTGYNGLIQLIFKLQYVESMNIKNKKVTLGVAPNYTFIKELFKNMIKYLIDKKIFTEIDIIRFVKQSLPNSDLKIKTKLKLKK